VGDEIERKVVLLNSVNHLENIVWFWAIIVAGAVPCICPPLPKDREQRKERIAYLRTLLDNPLIVTSKSLESEFDGLNGLQMMSSSKSKNINLP
jgi:acyl-CoA synthetase (AMP-forming)/AMP-acid ligase II